MFLSKIFKLTRAKAVIALAGLAMVFGSAAAISTVVATQQNEVVETKADDPQGTQTTLYCAVTLSNGATSMRINIRMQGESYNNNWRQHSMSLTGKTKGGAPIYSVTFYDWYNGLGTLQFQQMDGGTVKATHQIFGDPSWTSVGTYNGKMHVWATNGTNMVTYSEDSASKMSFYLDAGAWGLASGTKPKMYYWASYGYTDTDASPANITDIASGGTYSNTKYWKFTASYWGSLSGIIFFDGPSVGSPTSGHKTGDITSNLANNNIFNAASSHCGSNCDGYIYKITKYKKVGSAAAESLGTDYILGKMSYEVPTIDPEEGYVTPSSWNESPAGTGTARAPGSWISAVSADKTIYAIFTDAAGYFLVGNNSFGSFSIETGTPATSTGTDGNKASVESLSGFHVSTTSEFQFWHRAQNGTITYYGTLGTGYDYARASGKNIEIDPGHYNFYLNDSGNIYIVDVTATHEYGYLYIASSTAAGSITVTTKDGSGNPVVSGQALNAFTGFAQAPITTSFDSKSNLYCVPIYNLRGSSGGSIVTSVEYTISGLTSTITGIPNVTTTPQLYGSSGAADSAKGAAAEIFFNLATAIDGATDGSLCAVSSSNLSSFLTGYAGLSASTKTFIRSATVYTWTPDGNSFENNKAKVRTKTNVSIGTIYDYVSGHYNTSTGTWTVGVFSPTSNSESPLTLTLWVVLGAGTLGMGAIGAAYFVSKKKQRRAR